MTLQYPTRIKQLRSLVHKLGLSEQSPINWQLLDRALTHPSIAASDNYEQLEFVGDAVVRLATAEFLLENYPALPVGDFAAIRSILVSDRVLAQLAETYNLERYLALSDSALKDKWGRESRLAETFEALLGALYLSTGNLSLIRCWLDGHLRTQVPVILQDPARQNYKAALQEWSQAHYKILPDYRVTQSTAGDAGAHRFIAEVWLQGERLGWGSGRSIKLAEQAAAQVAFLSLTEAGELQR